MVGARWTEEEKSCFLGVVKGRIIQTLDFPTDEDGWPRVLDWTELKTQVLKRGVMVPVMKRVFEKPTYVLKMRYYRLKKQQSARISPRRKKWTNERRKELKRHVKSGTFGPLHKIQWVKLAETHYKDERSPGSLEKAWKKMKNHATVTQGEETCGVCSDRVDDQKAHVFKCCDKKAHYKCVKSYCISRFKDRARGKVMPSRHALNCFYCRHRQVFLMQE